MVATFSILGDLVKQVGGKHVAVKTLVGPNGDTHVFQPTPADARTLKRAKVLVENGLEFEGWIKRLVDASGFRGARVVATKGIKPIALQESGHHGDDGHKVDNHGYNKQDEHKNHEHNKHDKRKDHGHLKHHKNNDHGHTKQDNHKNHEHDKHKGPDHAGHDAHNHGAFDPHAWQSAANIIIYVNNIAAALSKADPANAQNYNLNRAAYVAKLKALDAEIMASMKALPKNARTVVTSHDAFGYFAKRYDLTFVAPQGISTESEASAKDVAKLITQIRREKISAVFVETITDNRLMEQIVRETGARIGGTLYSGALSDPDGAAPTYLDMMRHNAATLAKALGS